MNLNNNPTTAQLSKIISVCDDKAGHHILWVSKEGDVNITQINNISPIGFEKNTPSMAMRYETFQIGNDYVGNAASNDAGHMQRLLNDLINEWPLYNGKQIRYIG